MTTIALWETNANPESKTVGATVRPNPPIRRYCDTVRHLTQTLAQFGIRDTRSIVQHLARAGWLISKTTVSRYLQGPRIPTPRAPETPKRAVKARHPHHTWHLDLTQIPAFLRATTLHLAVMLDSFSRMPLTHKLFPNAPSATEMAMFFDQTVTRFGKPKYLIVDKGGEFTGDDFRDMTGAHRLRPRYASADNHRANSRIERFWRSLKAILQIVPARHLSIDDAELDVHRALVYYAYYRPHQGLGGATPAEVYFGVTPAHTRAAQPPRGRFRDPPVPPPATVEFLFGDRRFPHLRRVA